MKTKKQAKPTQKLCIQALLDRVIVRALKMPEKSKGGLFLADETRAVPVRGVVLSVGTGRWENGVLIPVPLEVGDVISYGKFSGSDIPAGGEWVKVLRMDEVMHKEMRVDEVPAGAWEIVEEEEAEAVPA